MKSSAFFVLFSHLVFTLSAASSQPPTKSVVSYKLIAPLKIDGILSEPLYEKPPITEFTQKDPAEGAPISEKTEMWIAYDEANIYFCGRFYDANPDSIDMTLMRRDKVAESDWLWIYMDPYNDDRTGNYFAVNPGGSICDGTLYNDGWMDDSWDGIWEAESSVDDKGWYTEVRIPFTQLRFNEAENMVWGINLNRDIKRKHEMAFLVMVPKNESGFVSKFADLVGLDGVKPKQRIEILPYLVQKAQYLHHNSNDPFYKDNQYQTSFGGDFKVSIGSNLNLDVTVNPDFGQVEVDPAIVNLTAFENFFEEKRPFFIEGENTFIFGYGGANNNWGFNFSTPTLFYSRRIGRAPQGPLTQAGYADYPSQTRILGASKLTGKINESWSLGVMSAFTEKTEASIQTSNSGLLHETVEPFTHYGVLRSLKEFNSGNQGLGMIFTSVNRNLDNANLSDILSKNAYTYGVDGWTYLDEDEVYALTASVIGSYTHGTKNYLTNLQKQPYRYFQRPDRTYMPLDTNRTSLSGMFSRIMLNKQKGNFYINTALGFATPGFEYNDLGSQWFADRINGHVVTGYRWYEPGKIFRRKSIYVAYNRNSDFEDNISRQGIYTTGSVQFTNWWGLGMNGNYNAKSTSVTLTRGGPKAQIPENYSFSIYGYTDSRNKIIFSPTIGFDKEGFGGFGRSYSVEIEWKPMPPLELTLTPAYEFTNSKYQWVTRFNDAYAQETYGTRYVFATIEHKTVSAEMRLNWSFTPKISLQFYAQPFFTVGDYSGFKQLARSNSAQFDVYGEDNSTISFDEDADAYTVDPDGNGPSEAFTFSNPNFNYKSIRGNAVLRWEVVPGSIFYLVWTHDKVNYEHAGEFDLTRDFTDLWRSEANNVFLAKFSYWFDL
ncbi:MAG: carbohydrate binding family 9 domain-containing protein [Deferribacteres bacterium]|nr:carbohydrate binding family 9 domain-containing protein [candidate division KSB1 bacterium]MCB9502584.1 carbohydrate binding family 9 domain-containing protein [Deferribacteres bacterium]